MKQLIILPLIAATLTCTLPAQSVSTKMGARGNGLGNATATIGDEWSLFNNVGGVAKVRAAQIGFAHETRTTLIGADRSAALIIIPTKNGASAIGMLRFGDEVYSEQVVCAGYGNQFGNTSLGIKANLIQYSAQGQATKRVGSISVGGMTRVTSFMTIGAYIINVNQPQLSNNNDERLPVQMIAGVGFTFTKEFFVAAEVEKDLAYQPTLRFGMEYVIHGKLSCRTGFNLHPNSSSFGLGFQQKKINIGIAIQYTRETGLSSQASCNYRFKKSSR